MPQLTEMMLHLDALIKIKTQLLIAYSATGGAEIVTEGRGGGKEMEGEADSVEARQGITFGCQSER